MGLLSELGESAVRVCAPTQLLFEQRPHTSRRAGPFAQQEATGRARLAAALRAGAQGRGPVAGRGRGRVHTASPGRSQRRARHPGRGRDQLRRSMGQGGRPAPRRLGTVFYRSVIRAAPLAGAGATGPRRGADPRQQPVDQGSADGPGAEGGLAQEIEVRGSFRLALSSVDVRYTANEGSGAIETRRVMEDGDVMVAYGLVSTTTHSIIREAVLEVTDNGPGIACSRELPVPLRRPGGGNRPAGRVAGRRRSRMFGRL